MDKEMKTETFTIKKKRKNFTMVDNDIVNNPNLSYKAKGILLYLLSKPDGWKVNIVDLIKHSKDGEYSIRRGLKELKQYGYYDKIPLRENNKIKCWVSYIFENPEENPNYKCNNIKNVKNLKKIANTLLGGFQQVENLQVENCQRNNTDFINTDFINNNNIEQKEEIKNVVVEEQETNCGTTQTSEEKKDIKKEPLPQQSNSNENELNKVHDLISINFNTDLKKNQLEKILVACKFDFEYLEEKIKYVNERTSIKNPIGYLMQALKDDYKLEGHINNNNNNDNSNNNTNTNTNPINKNRIVNYVGRKWDFKKIAALEMQQLIDSTGGFEDTYIDLPKSARNNENEESNNENKEPNNENKEPNNESDTE